MFVLEVHARSRIRRISPEIKFIYPSNKLFKVAVKAKKNHKNV